jgi:hypothetical protein
LVTTRLPELLSLDLQHRDSAADTDSIINSDTDSIINCVWIQHQGADGIQVYLGGRSGVLHKLFCNLGTRSTQLINSLKLSDSPLEFVFVQGSQACRDELLVVGEGQWLIDLKQRDTQPEVRPIVADFQSFDGACNACAFRSPSTPSGVIVSLRPLPKPFPSIPGSDVGGAIIMTLPSVDNDATHECKVTNLSQINIGAACSHVAVLPRLSLTIVAAVVHNRASLLFISQGRVIHCRPLIAAGGGEFVSMDAREDEGDLGSFTVVAALAGGRHDAAFNVSRGDFALFGASVDGDLNAHGGEERRMQGGTGAVAGAGGAICTGGTGGAICILRARMKTKIEEGEQFSGGRVQPAATNFKVWIAFDEPFYERCARDALVQGAGILSLAAGSSAATVTGSRQLAVTCVSGATCGFSQDNARIAVKCARRLSRRHFLILPPGPLPRARRRQPSQLDAVFPRFSRAVLELGGHRAAQHRRPGRGVKGPSVRALGGT